VGCGREQGADGDCRSAERECPFGLDVFHGVSWLGVWMLGERGWMSTGMISV